MIAVNKLNISREEPTMGDPPSFGFAGMINCHSIKKS